MDFYEPHPWGVLPCGNASASERPRVARLGSALGTVPESIGADIVAMCDAASLAQLAATSTGLYININGSNDVWRALTAALAQPYQAASPSNVVEYQGTWRATAVWLHLQLLAIAGRSPLSMSEAAIASTRSPCCRSFPDRPWHSDSMFQSWLCTLMPPDFKRLDRAAARAAGLGGTPSAWCASPMFRDVPREHGLSTTDFKAKYEGPNVPVILTDVAKKWPLFDILGGDLANLSRRAGDILASSGDAPTRFRCESILMSLPGYAAYAAEQRDERAAYLFDADFNDGPFKDGLWEVPAAFAVDDLFGALGNKRPNYRWLIAGPARAGSSFHIDPNFTNAWNACLTGRKRWLMFPPNVVPPGVYPSEDMADVTTPVSLTEWLLNYYEESRRLHHKVGYECICEPGETIFVPCGWWHCVINLEASVAVTQNYVSDSNLGKVIKFLKTMPKSISGIGEEDGDAADIQRRRAGFYQEFADKVKRHRRDLAPLVDATLDELHAIEAARNEARKRPRMADALRFDAPAGPAQPRAADEAEPAIPADGADAGGGFTFDF